MAPAERPWLRLYSETTRDRKLRREKPEVRWLWIAILCMAGASRERGTLLVGASIAQVSDIADEAALPVAKVKRGLAVLEAAGLIDQVDGAWRVVKWAERQYESDKSTPRVKAFRERRRNVSGNGSVTPPDTESESEDNSSPHVEHAKPVENPNRDDEEDPRFCAVLESRIRKRMDGRTDIGNAKAYRAALIGELLPDADRTRKLLADFPDAPAQSVAGHLDGEQTTLAMYRTKEPIA